MLVSALKQRPLSAQFFCIIFTVFISALSLVSCVDPGIVLRGHHRSHFEKPKSNEHVRPEQLTILASRILKPQSEYHVIISLANSSSPATVDIQIIGARDSDHERVEAKSVLIESGETQRIKFNVANWPSTVYMLNASAEAIDRSWNFSKEAWLDFKDRNFMALTQTDKAIYKPGQKVKFRTLLLNEDLKPISKLDGAVFTVVDPDSHIVKEWKDPPIKRGLVSLEMPLSEDPILGIWLIKLDAREHTFSKEFQVAEYILPTFDVQIRLPSFAAVNESDIVATVQAAYTFGKPVKGHVVLTVQPLSNFINVQAKPMEQAQFRAPLINGSADFSFDVIKNLNIEEVIHDREIEFFALVEEDLTGKKYNKTSTMRVYENKIKMEVVNERTVKPGLNHTVLVKVAYQDDIPVEDNGPEVDLRLERSGAVFESAKLQPKRGLVEYTFKVPNNNSELSSISLIAYYRGKEHYLTILSVFPSESMQFISLSLPKLSLDTNGNTFGQRPVSVGDKLRVRLEGTEPIPKINCHGVARGNIVWVLSKDLNGSKVHEFDIEVDMKMSPQTYILCHYVRPENKELIADAVEVQVDDLMTNFVKINPSREEAKPGQAVQVDVYTKPHSLVGILGVDQSVYLLKSGNDISQDDVRDGVNSLGSHGSLQPWNTESMFQSSNLAIITNSLMYDRRYEWIAYQMSDMNASPRLGSSKQIVAVPVASNAFVEKVAAPLVIRKNFPETWLWDDATAGKDGKAEFEAKMPDTITSWILSAFSMHESHGLGLSKGTTSIRVFKPFFIKLNLPYSIIRGETLNLQAVIFNYMKRPVDAKVTLTSTNNEFEFTEAANNIEDEVQLSQSSETRQVNIPAEESISVSFLIKPLKLGYIDINIGAVSFQAGDSVVKKLLVKPEGQTQHFNKAMLIHLTQDKENKRFTRNVSIEIPANAVPGSQKVSVSAIGDILGPGLSNVDDLLRIPYGCGEQNMINLVPNIAILNYLDKSGRLGEAKRQLALRNIETGYQRELNYKRADGSFSAFGNIDKNGSTWLTAYVLKTFQEAKKFIKVDPGVISDAANYIVARVQQSGQIEEVGMVHHKDLQSSGASSSLYITAYSVIALNGKESEEKTNATLYLENRLDEIANKENPYELAITAYALELERRGETADRAYKLLWSRVNEAGEQAWWSSSSAKTGSSEESAALLLNSSTTVPPLKPFLVTKKHSANHFVPDSLSIEMTAFALLSTVRRNELDRALPIVNWLVSKQNSNGGFASTQDTVLAIEALSSFAAAVATRGRDDLSAISMEMNFVYPSEKPDLLRSTSYESIQLKEANKLIYQKISLPDNTSWVNIEANGSGAAVAHVAWQYNLLVSAEQPAFYLNPVLDKVSTIDYLQLSICTSYLADEASNMALMEVELPSGYTTDVETLSSLKRIPAVMRVDTSKANTMIFIYFDRVTKDEICLTVPAHRTSKVSNNQKVPVFIYDYYNRQKAARIFYEPFQASSCDICESETCINTCAKKPKQSERLIGLHEQRSRRVRMIAGDEALGVHSVELSTDRPIHIEVDPSEAHDSAMKKHIHQLSAANSIQNTPMLIALLSLLTLGFLL